MIKELVIIGEIITLLNTGNITEEKLVQYFENNKTLLRNNIEQAIIKYKKDNLSDIVKDIYPKYLENKEQILSNSERFSVINNQVVEKFTSTYGNDIPDLVLVPCIGLFAPGGWADKIDGTYHIFVALERLKENFALDILLTHEIAHGISEDKWEIVLDGIFREGYATYVSSVFCPGHNEEVYLYMKKEFYRKCITWIDKNRDRIYEDSGKPIEVMNKYHKFYFTTSYNSDYPNIGYVIGYEYLKYLNKKYTLDELCTFGIKESKNESEFKEFIFGWSPP